MANEDYIRAIKAVPLFSAMDSRQLTQLLDTCRVVRFKAEEMIFGPTQAAEQFYVVLKGHVKIYKLSARGDEQILHMYGHGETFGEAAMWARINYPAHALALEESQLLVVSLASLRKLIEHNADLALRMMAGLSAKLREFNQLIEELALKEVPARIAGMLLGESRRTGHPIIKLKQTKRQLAAQIGTIAETLSRALAKMKAQGLIDVRGSEIEILDAGALEDLAHSG